MKHAILSERFWILGCLVLLLACAYIPLFQNSARAPADRWYYGADEYPLDFLGDLTFVREGYNGLWQAYYNYSSTIPELHHPLLKIEYVLIGHLARIMHADTMVTFYGVRFVLSFIYFFAVYMFIRSLFSRRSERIAAWVFVLFAVAIMRPGDPKGFFAYSMATSDMLVNYRMILAMPHYLLGGICGLVSVYLLAKTLDKPNALRYFIGAVAAGFVSSIEYAPTTVLIISTLPVYVIIQIIRRMVTHVKQNIRQTIGVFFAYTACVILPIIYVQFAIASLSKETGNLEQLNPFSIPWWEYPLAAGAVYVLAVIGIPIILKKGKTFPILLSAWLLMHPIGEYIFSPLMKINYIRYWLTPYFVVFGILAVYGIRTVLSFVTQRLKTTVFILLVAAVLASGYFSYQTINMRSYVCFCAMPIFSYAYPAKTTVDSIYWLRDHTKYTDIVLSKTYSGNLIGALSGNWVYTSWWFRLTNLPQAFWTIQQADAFFSQTMTSGDALSLVVDNRIQHVYYGEEEHNFQENFVPLSYPFLREEYRNAGVIIYRVIR